MKCKYTSKKNCGTEIDVVGRSTVQVGTKPKAQVHSLAGGIVYSLPDASNDFTITLLHSGPVPFYSTYANLEMAKKWKVGQEVGGKVKLGVVKENAFEITLSVEGGGGVELV